MIGAQTIGNATVIAYDKNPILATDPWLGLDHFAYFGSWYLPYEIPENIHNDILSSKYIFFLMDILTILIRTQFTNLKIIQLYLVTMLGKECLMILNLKDLK